jgi:two-component system, sporulation sensor kinase E
MKAGFLEKLIERLGRIGPEEVQNYFLRLAQEKGFLETVFNAIHEGIIVTDSNGRVTYLNDAACKSFGLEAADAIGKRLDERVRGLDWGSLTQSGGPLSRDMEIFYPENRFINFYIVPLMIEHREAVDVAKPMRGVREETDHPPSRGYGEANGPAATVAGQVGHVMILRDITESRRTAHPPPVWNGLGSAARTACTTPAP